MALKKKISSDWRRTGAGISLILYFAALAFLCYHTRSNIEAQPLTANISLVGAAMGWLVGVLVSPYNKLEKELFNKYAGAISVFISGYVLGKVDPIISELLRPDIVVIPIVAFRILSFILAFLVSLLWTHAVRSYRYDSIMLDESSKNEEQRTDNAIVQA